jgi:hypothetical protein
MAAGPLALEIPLPYHESRAASFYNIWEVAGVGNA